MNFFTQTFQHYPELSALAGVLVVAALISFSSRHFGEIALSDLAVGPQELFKTALVSSALYALLLTGVAAFAASTAWSFPLALPIAAAAGMVAFINALSPAMALRNSGAGVAEIARRKELGKAMAARCLSLFQRVDRRGKGRLNEDDLNAAIARADLTASDKEALIYVRDNAENIGTLVERSATRNHVVPGALTSGFVMVVPQTTNLYAVSEDDLNSYPQRLEQIYKLWD